jgi:hypothetical protein
MAGGVVMEAIADRGVGGRGLGSGSAAAKRWRGDVMAKHDTDPVLAQLVRAVDESGQARVPVTVTAHGTVVSGLLISQDAYFTALAEASPLLSALAPDSELLGKEYAKDVDAGSGRHLHIRAAAGGEGLWRLSLEAVDGWKAGALKADADDDKGPFARLLGA